jgi:alkylation response protein AidB-like acyl-CoA dehydrogenase
LQLHGGYGYFDDFGLDKYYRDSMALFVFFPNSVTRMEELSTAVFGSKSGFL